MSWSCTLAPGSVSHTVLWWALFSAAITFVLETFYLLSWPQVHSQPQSSPSLASQMCQPVENKSFMIPQGHTLCKRSTTQTNCYFPLFIRSLDNGDRSPIDWAQLYCNSCSAKADEGRRVGHGFSGINF